MLASLTTHGQGVNEPIVFGDPLVLVMPIPEFTNANGNIRGARDTFLSFFSFISFTQVESKYDKQDSTQAMPRDSETLTLCLPSIRSCTWFPMLLLKVTLCEFTQGQTLSTRIHFMVGCALLKSILQNLKSATVI